MNIAIIGKGRTGGALLTLLEEDQIIGPFGRSNPATVSALKAADVAICFVPAEAMSDLLPLMLDAGIPAVWGVTGYQWPVDIDARLKAANLTWVQGHNFSLMMPVVRKALNALGAIAKLRPESTQSIHEAHHIHKVDAPSGTALSWADWLNVPSERITITSTREGDIIGHHALTIDTADETITLTHDAKDRQLFAQGALWAARTLLNGTTPAGMHAFHDLVDQAL